MTGDEEKFTAALQNSAVASMADVQQWYATAPPSR